MWLHSRRFLCSFFPNISFALVTSTKREAQEWERDFLSQSSASLEMKFSDFIDIYFKDMEQRLKRSTISNKRFMVDLKITPYFGKMPLSEIKPTDIRAWQNSLTSYRDENGTAYSPTYLKAIQNQITAIFNYAVKYYNLKENPCHKAGSMGKKNADEIFSFSLTYGCRISCTRIFFTPEILQRG